MNIIELTDALASPGKLVFIPCGVKEDAREMIRQISAALQPRLNRRKRCAKDKLVYAIQSSALISDDSEFKDLVALSQLILTAAGFSDSYDGLLVVDIRSLDADAVRCERKLAALGEGLSVWMRNGYTVVLAPQRSELTCAVMDAFEQSIEVACVSLPDRQNENREIMIPGLEELSRETVQEINRITKELSADQAQLLMESLRTGNNRITEASVADEKQNPYSRLNRCLNRIQRNRRAVRGIGFCNDSSVS